MTSRANSSLDFDRYDTYQLKRARARVTRTNRMTICERSWEHVNVQQRIIFRLNPTYEIF
jgi:hypothetical protein